MDDIKISPSRLIGLVLVYFFVLFVVFRLVFSLEVIKPEGRDAIRRLKAVPAREQPAEKGAGNVR